MRTKILITVAVFFCFVIFIAIGAFLFTQTEYFRTLVRRTAESIVSSSTGQNLTIGKVEGNFFYTIKLRDVSFEVENENFVSVDEISLRYSLPQMLDGTMLFSKVVPVDDVTVKGVNVDLIKYEDGTWNFGKIGGGEKKEKKDKEKSSPPDWSVILSGLLLQNADITVEDRQGNKTTDYRIEEIDLSAKLINITEKIEVDLKNAALDAPSQNLSIRDFSADAIYSEDKAAINDLKVLLNGAEIKIDADAENLKGNPDFSFNASAKNYKLEDVGTFNLEAEGGGKFISPENIQAEASIKIPESEVFGRKLTGSLENIKMSGTELRLGEGNITTSLGNLMINGSADLKRILAKEGSNSFNIDLKLSDVKTTEIFTLLEEKADTKTEAINTDIGAVLNASLKAEGSWVEFSDLNAKGNIESLDIEGKEAGDLKLTGTVDYSESGLGLDIKSSLNKVDIGTILSKPSLDSDITSDLSINGNIPLKGDILEQASGNVTGEINPSSIFGVNIEKGDINVSYDQQRLDVQALSLTGKSFKLVVEEGGVGAEGLDLDYDIDIENLGFVSAFAPNTDISGSLKAKGKVTGELTKPKVTIDATASEVEVNEDFSADSVKIDGEGVIDLNSPELSAEIDVETANVKGKKLESIGINASSEDSKIDLNVKITENDQFNYEINTVLSDLASQEKHIEITNVKLDMDDTELQNKESIFITIAPGKLLVDSFNLYYGDSSALADARIFYDGTLDANLKISNLELEDITKAIQFETPLQGKLSTDVNVQGTMEDPQFNASINGSQIVYQDFQNDEVSLNVNYLNQNLNLKFVITNNNATVMQATGNANVDLNFKKLGENIDSATFNLSVDSSGVDLSPLASVVEEIEKSEGMLVVDLKASGRLGSPTVNGQLSMKDAVFKIQSLGNELNITNAVVEMDGQKGYLRQLEINSGKGSGNFEGEIDLANFTYNLDGKLDNFLIRPKRIKSTLSGNIDVTGEGSKLKAEGNITVSRSRITLPEEEKKQIEEIKFVDEGKEEFVVSTKDDEDFFKENIALKLQVRLTRNNWVKGKGANVEIRGNLDVDKEYSEDVRITGSIRTVRGTYETLGKLFRIEQGRVSFSGTTDINPNLDITALYRVSDVQIYINISGTAKSPEVKLTSDPAMQETDIISYLVFGAPSDQIGSGDRAAISGVATGIAGGIAASQLETLLGQNLSPDVLSVGGGSQGPQIEVGKYLTQDLYIAYERGTTQSILDSTTITTNKVLVEYTVFKNVTIDADVGGENPGADIFYNFNY